MALTQRDSARYMQGKTKKTETTWLLVTVLANVQVAVAMPDTCQGFSFLFSALLDGGLWIAHVGFVVCYVLCECGTDTGTILEPSRLAASIG